MAISFDSIRNFFLGSATGTLDANFSKVADEFDRTVYRDGSAVMSGSLDMNSQRIINLPYPRDENDAVNLGVVRQIASTISQGPAGPADNTYTSYAELLASDKSRKKADLVGDTDNPPTADGTFRVVNGVWTRESISGSTFSRTDVGAVERSAADKAREIVSAFDFGAIADGVRHTLSERFATIAAAKVRYPFVTSLSQTIDWAALQAAINATQSDSIGRMKRLTVPTGNYVISDPLILSKQFVQIEGANNSSVINFTGVAGGCLKAASINYLRPVIRGLYLNGDETSGPGIDLSAVKLQTYLGCIEDITIYSGDSCLLAPGNPTDGVGHFFSMVVRNIHGHSYRGHSFHVFNGPGNSYTALYALRAGPGKAGFRMAGPTTLINCNGLNEGDFWGVFGSNLTGTGYVSKFNADFRQTDYPDVTLDGCNLEEWSSLSNQGAAIVLTLAYRRFVTRGIKIDRSSAPLLARIPTYYCILWSEQGAANPNVMLDLDIGQFYMSGSAISSNWVTRGGGRMIDRTGTAGPLSIFDASANAYYPAISIGHRGDIYSGECQQYSALSARRFSAQVIRYDLAGPAITGSTTSVDVTGVTKVGLQPTAPATLQRFTFNETIGSDTSDYGRNGELILEAYPGSSVTLAHAAGGRFQMHLKGTANRVLLTGEIVRFVWSDSMPGGSGWWEI